MNQIAILFDAMVTTGGLTSRPALEFLTLDINRA
jgi:hypothetical protein